MAESRSRGTPSSLKKTISVDSYTPALESLISSDPILSISRALGGDAMLHLVGGSVRDVLLGEENVDFDLASAFTPEETIKRLEKVGIRTVPTGIKHGTVTAVKEGVPVEITSFRGQSSKTPSIEEDLNARDFTINAIAYSLSSKKLIDPTGGIPDLEHHHLRAVGDPADRFNEDPLRILRLVRFGYAAGRTVDPATENAAKMLSKSLGGISVERIKHELDEILISTSPAEGIRALYTLNLLEYTIPELLPTIGFEQNKFHIHDVFEHTLAVIDACPPDLILKWSALFHDIGKAHTLSVDAQGNRHFYEHERVSTEIGKVVMERLRFSNDDIDSISKLVRLHMRPLDCGMPGVRRLMRDLGPEFDRWCSFKRADKPPVYEDSRVEEALTGFLSLVQKEKDRTKGSVYGKLAVTGDDLITMGLKPGKVLGGILKELQNHVIENPDANEREVLLEKARTLIAQNDAELTRHS